MDRRKRTRHRLEGPSKDDAERQAIDKVRATLVTQAADTIAGIWEAYRIEKEGRRVAVAMKHEAKAVLPHFGHLRSDQVTVETSRAYIALRRAKGKHDGTIWTELGHLRTALKWAKERRLIEHAPTIERPAKPAPRDRWLTDAEIRKLLDAPMAEHIRLAILLMLSTACRVTAALELTWDRVNFDAGTIDLRLDATGPRKGRAVVPMNAGLKSAQSIKTGFNKAVKGSGLVGVTPHVLRHTAAVKLASSGVPMTRISQFLGHTSTAVTERVYARFAPDHLQEKPRGWTSRRCERPAVRSDEPASTPLDAG